MPRRWAPGDPHFGEYQTILFDASFDETGELQDTEGTFLTDTDDNQLLDTNGVLVTTQVLTWNYEIGTTVTPLGTGAVEVVESNLNEWHETESNPFQIPQNVEGVYTVRIKRGSGTRNAAVWAYQSRPANPDPWAYALIDMTTGALLYTTSNSTVANHSFDVIAESGGWFRVTIRLTFTNAYAADDYSEVYVDLSTNTDGSNGAVSEYLGDGVSSLFVEALPVQWLL